MENSCCEQGMNNAIKFFKEKSPDINHYNERVKEMGNSLQHIQSLTKAKILFFTKNTKPVYLPITEEVMEDTIYKAFIRYCNFNKSIPIDETLKSVCLEKPEDFDSTESINNQITFLKRVGRRYTTENFNMLINIINNRNIIPESHDVLRLHHTQVLLNTLDSENSLYNEQTSPFPLLFLTKIYILCRYG